MRNIILNNIKTGLKEEIGLDGNYENYEVEMVDNRLPDSVLVNRFVGITIDRARASEREIGKNYPTMTDYVCSVVVRVKSADYDSGQTELDTIVRRIIKYFANDTGSLRGLTNTTDGVEEQVATYAIEELDYVSGEAKNKGLLHICLISLIIRTNLTI